jgi:NAD(P)-dependent dehydrogenase (short-subunit alcohol dehydrogenase family)
MNRIEAGGKVALVTGAADCIGLAAGIALIRAGYRVFGTSRNAKPNEKVQGIQMLRCDVTSDESVSQTIKEVLARAGRIDVLVNNAGRSLIGGAEESSIGQAQALFDVMSLASKATPNPSTTNFAPSGFASAWWSRHLPELHWKGRRTSPTA